MNHPNALPNTSPLFGLYTCCPHPCFLEKIGADWDWIWIDGQHGQLDYQGILALVRMCDLIRRPALVRVASHEYGEIGRTLDTGPAGIIVPCVDTVEQAKEVVYAAKYPPIGNRSCGSSRIFARQGWEAVETANAEVALIVQIETPLALSHAEEIAALPGIDGLFYGPDDMTLRRGIPINAPRTREMIGPDLEIILRACRKHRKKAVTAGAGAEMIGYAIKLGFDLIAGGSDFGFMVNGSKKSSADLRAAAASK